MRADRKLFFQYITVTFSHSQVVYASNAKLLFFFFFFLGIHSTDTEVNFSLLMELADNFFTTSSIPADDGYQGPRLLNSNSGGFDVERQVGGIAQLLMHLYKTKRVPLKLHS